MKLEKDGPAGNQKLIAEGFDANQPPTPPNIFIRPIDPNLSNINTILQEINEIFGVRFRSHFSKICSVILQNPPPFQQQSSILISNITKDFSQILLQFLNLLKPLSPLKLLTEVDIPVRHLFFGNYLINVARMLSKFEYFANLNPSEKVCHFRII